MSKYCDECGATIHRCCERSMGDFHYSELNEELKKQLIEAKSIINRMCNVAEAGTNEEFMVVYDNAREFLIKGK